MSSEQILACVEISGWKKGWKLLTPNRDHEKPRSQVLLTRVRGGRLWEARKLGLGQSAGCRPEKMMSELPQTCLDMAWDSRGGKPTRNVSKGIQRGKGGSKHLLKNCRDGGKL